MKSPDKEFMLERYRYILEQKKFLNKTTFVVASVYQAGLAVIVAGNYQLWTALADSKLSRHFVSLASDGLVLLLWVLALFSASMIVSGAASWLAYRSDEAVIEETYLGGKRSPPSIGNIFRWYETYVVIGIFVITVGFSVFLTSLHKHI